MAISEQQLATLSTSKALRIVYNNQLWYIHEVQPSASYEAYYNLRGGSGQPLGITVKKAELESEGKVIEEGRTFQPTTKEQIYSSIYKQSKAEEFWTAEEKATVTKAEATAQSTAAGIVFTKPTKPLKITSYNVIDPATEFKAKLQPEVPIGITGTAASSGKLPAILRPTANVYTKAPEIETIEGFDLVGLVSPQRLESGWSPAESFISYGALGLTRFYTGIKEVGGKALFGSPLDRIEAFQDIVVGATVGIPYGIAYNIKTYGFTASAAGITAGELAPAIVGFKALKSMPKPRLVYIDIPLEGGLSSRITSFGIEAGTRKVGIATYSEGRLSFGLPKVSDTPLKIAKDVEVAAPAGSLEAEVLARTTLKPAQYEAYGSRIETLRVLSKEKGLDVERIELNLQQLKRPAEATKVIEKIALEEDLVFFGSATTQQLPLRYRVKVLGDVDLIKASGTADQAIAITKKLETGLKNIGEDVRISVRAGQQRAIVETVRGEKVLEIKTGTEADALLSGSSPAAAGYAGFDFPNLRAGMLGQTVKFGEGKAIYAGEQLLRKAAASGFFRGPTTDIRTPAALREGGMFPTGKRPKDVADYYTQALGVEESRVFRDTVTVGKIREQFVKGYTAEQRVEISRLIRKRITGEELVPEKVIFKPAKPATVANLIESAEPAYSYTFRTSSVIKSAYSGSRFTPSRYSSIVSSGNSLASSVVASSSSSKSTYSSVLSSIGSVGSSIAPSPSKLLSKYSSSPYSGSKYGSSYESGYKSPSTYSQASSIASQLKGSLSKSDASIASTGSDFKTGYIPYIRREGKFYPLTGTPLTKKGALALGGKVVDTTAAATFFIRAVTAKDVSDLGGSLKRPQFYRKGEKYIEYSKFRISTAGELSEITAKGIQASRAKLNIKRLF